MKTMLFFVDYRLMINTVSWISYLQSLLWPFGEISSNLFFQNFFMAEFQSYVKRRSPYLAMEMLPNLWYLLFLPNLHWSTSNYSWFISEYLTVIYKHLNLFQSFSSDCQALWSNLKLLCLIFKHFDPFQSFTLACLILWPISELF